MNRQDFDKWKEEEVKTLFPELKEWDNLNGGSYRRVTEHIIKDRKLWMDGADAAYNLLSKSHESEIELKDAAINEFALKNISLSKEIEVLNEKVDFLKKELEIMSTTQNQ